MDRYKEVKDMAKTKTIVVLENQYGEPITELEKDVYGYYEAPQGTRILFDKDDVLRVKEVEVEEK